MYLLAPEQNSVVERAFSFQNLILSPRRSKLLLENVSKKILIKYCKLILSESEIRKCLETAATAHGVLPKREELDLAKIYKEEYV